MKSRLGRRIGDGHQVELLSQVHQIRHMLDLRHHAGTENPDPQTTHRPPSSPD